MFELWLYDIQTINQLINYLSLLKKEKKKEIIKSLY